jgi:hypothetical protein
MIDSCRACITKCCKAGPGPYRRVKVQDWLFNLQGSKKYNTFCEHFDLAKETCNAWGSGKLPLTCRVYICSKRTFSETELAEIDFLLGRYDAVTNGEK